MQKHSISQTEFESTDWDATGKAASLLSPSTCIYISKHTTGFLPIGKNMVRRGQWREPYCPRCQSPLETTDHLFQCPHPSSTKIFQASIQRLEAWLVSVSTDTTLTDQIIEIITLWRGNAQIHTNPNYLPPINCQIQLGWKHFMHGRLHSSFREFMYRHYSSINSKRQSTTWAAILVQKIWTILHKPQWESRNKFVHNLDRVTETSRERLNLQSDLKSKYNSEIKENLLQRDQFLYDEPLSTLRKLPNTSIKSFHTATKARDMTFDIDDSNQSAFMRTFLATHQPPPTSRSGTPNKRISSSMPLHPHPRKRRKTTPGRLALPPLLSNHVPIHEKKRKTTPGRRTLPPLLSNHIPIHNTSSSNTQRRQSLPHRRAAIPIRHSKRPKRKIVRQLLREGSWKPP